LIELSMYEGIKSGFVLNFRDDDTNMEDTYYISIEDFSTFLNETHKKSINKADCELRGLSVESKFKRTNYKYNVKKMLEDIIRKES